MNLHISNISMIGPVDLATGLATGKWPHISDLIARGKAIGASCLEVTMLRGWMAEEVIGFADFICSLEAPWCGEELPERYMDKQLFGNRAYDQTHDLYRMMRMKDKDILTVDFRMDKNTCYEVSGEEKHRGLVSRIKDDGYPGRSLPPLVYDTWHSREVLPLNMRKDWMRSPVCDLFVEPMWNTWYHREKGQSFRESVNRRIEQQWKLMYPGVRMVQIQTRSYKEASRFLDGEPTMLGYQVFLIKEYVRQCEAKGWTPPLVALEFMPYWTLSFHEKLLKRVDWLFEPQMGYVS